ncbi:MAG: universal stress protein [Salinimicrobium sp.]
MKNILLPTDFSENAYNAVKFAVQLFKDEECRFFLLNTYTPVLYDNEYLVYSASQPTLTEIYRNNSAKGLERVVRRVKRNFHNDLHSFEKLSSFNLLSDEIKEIVKEKNIDLIVMGTKGATGAEEILFGSHTVHAIKKVKCPLLAVPAHYDFKVPEQILFPTDYEPKVVKLLPVVKEIAAANKATLHFMHVYFGVELSEEQARTKQALNRHFKEVDHQFYSISDKSVPQAIYDFQEEHNIDLLVLINNKHSFFENLLFRPIVNEIGFHVKVPFLVIPSGNKK